MKLSCNTRRSLSISFEWLYLFSDTSTSMPQWGSVRAVWFILLTMVITRPMKLEKVPVNSKITASWWTNISPKQYSCILNLTNMKNEELLDSKRDCVSITRPCMIRHGTWEREWQNHSIESNKICLPSLSDIKRYKQLKLDFDKMLGWQNFLFQVCPFVPVLYLLWYENMLQWCKSNKPFHVFFATFDMDKFTGKSVDSTEKSTLKLVQLPSLKAVKN